MQVISRMQSWIFSIITPVFSVTWSFRYHSNMLICCTRNISDSAQETFLCKAVEYWESLLMNMCFHDLKSNLNMLDSTLLLTACVCGAGFCLALACVLFPDSWACAEMRRCVGSVWVVSPRGTALCTGRTYWPCWGCWTPPYWPRWRLFWGIAKMPCCQKMPRMVMVNASLILAKINECFTACFKRVEFR